MSDKVILPKYDELYGPTLSVLKSLGGSATIQEINDGVVAEIAPTEAQLEATYEKSGGLVLPDRMSWARSLLKAGGFIANASKGVWILTEAGQAVVGKSGSELRKLVSTAYKASVAAKKASEADLENDGPMEVENTTSWDDHLLQQIQSLEPAAFERLCQRLLRESGFISVNVTGKAGDGGIDGTGVLRMNLISFHVLFQCKRYKGSVGTGTVRDFRGAMQGRADKGLIITTGTFTVDARGEAKRDGAPAIDLINGKELCVLLKELKLGVRVETRLVEDITVDERFFATV